MEMLGDGKGRGIEWNSELRTGQSKAAFCKYTGTNNEHFRKQKYKLSQILY